MMHVDESKRTYLSRALLESLLGVEIVSTEELELALVNLASLFLDGEDELGQLS